MSATRDAGADEGFRASVAGRYAVREVLGEGGTGTVYLADEGVSVLSGRTGFQERLGASV